MPSLIVFITVSRLVAAQTAHRPYIPLPEAYHIRWAAQAVETGSCALDGHCRLRFRSHMTSPGSPDIWTSRKKRSNLNFAAPLESDLDLYLWAISSASPTSSYLARLREMVSRSGRIV